VNLLLKGKLHNFSNPLVMGILNITPDSFYSGSRVDNPEMAKDKIALMFDEGADIVDIGAMSSRPGAEILDTEDEWKRLEPILKIVSAKFADKYFSLDTLNSVVAARAVNDYGIDIINDISAGNFDKKMFETIAALNVPYIIMHMNGTPSNMQQKTNYNSLLGDIILYFSEKIKELNSLGVNDIIVDPGFGFSKTIDQNFTLLNNLESFSVFEMPVLVGLSRKSMIWKQLNTTPEHALNGITALNMLALSKGANIIRVHDVKEAVELVSLYCKTTNSTEKNWK